MKAPTLKPPVPEVGALTEQSHLPAPPFGIRTAMLLIVIFGIANVIREVFYAVGAVQVYGMVLGHNILAIGRALFHGGSASFLARRLGRLEQGAWWATFVWSFGYLVKRGWELNLLLTARANGYARTEVQIAWLICMIGILIIADLYLLTHASRAAFGFGSKSEFYNNEPAH